MRIALGLALAFSTFGQSFPAPGPGRAAAGGGGGGATFISGTGKHGPGGNASITTDALDITGATSAYVTVTGFAIAAESACSVTDNNANTYSVVTPTSGGSTPPGLGLFFSRGLTGASGYTWTANCGSGASVSIGVMAFSGAGTTGGPDHSSNGFATGTSIAPGSITTSVASLLVTGLSINAAGSSATVPTGYTIPTAGGDGLNFSAGGGTAMPLAMAYKIQSGAGSENPTWTISSAQANAAQASFH